MVVVAVLCMWQRDTRVKAKSKRMALRRGLGPRTDSNGILAARACVRVVLRGVVGREVRVLQACSSLEKDMKENYTKMEGI